MDGTEPLQDLFDVLRLGLKPDDALLHVLANTGGAPQSEHVKGIIRAILWHRKFLLTYYAWIVAAVVLSSAHATWRGWQRKSKPIDEQQGTCDSSTSPSSSSSSTLQGIITPPQKDDGLIAEETTTLLPHKESQQRPKPGSWERLRSFLLYQPRPIPALTSSFNTVPDNGTTILVLCLLAVNLFYLVYRIPFGLSVFVIADRAGLLFVTNLPVLYILAAKNNQPIKYLTGWSYEGLNIFHRRLGEWMTCFALIHMIGMFAAWYTLLRPVGFTLLRYLFAKVVWLGLLAAISYYIIYATSTGWFRKLYYELFLGLHIFFQVAALVFLFFHYPTAKPFVGASLAIWVLDRGIWRIATSSRKFIATLEVAPDGQTVLLFCDIPLKQRSLLHASLRNGWAPGQHLFLTLPSMSFKYRFQAHPFTIASPAPPQNNAKAVDSWPLQLTIRAIDGFSLDLLNYARHHAHCEVTLDGPYGSTTTLNAVKHADRVCFVAGGSGIAVTYPLAWAREASDTNNATDILVMRNRYVNGVKCTPDQRRETHRPHDPNFAHFWVRQDGRHARWITMFAKVGGVVLQGQDMLGLITRSFDTRPTDVSRGRPDMKSEVWDWVTSLGADTLDEAKKQTVCVVVSGPDGLVRDVRNTCAQLVKEGWHIDIHVEKFGW